MLAEPPRTHINRYITLNSLTRSLSDLKDDLHHRYQCHRPAKAPAPPCSYSNRFVYQTRRVARLPPRRRDVICLRRRAYFTSGSLVFTGYIPDKDPSGKEIWPRGDEKTWKEGLRGVDSGKPGLVMVFSSISNPLSSLLRRPVDHKVYR